MGSDASVVQLGVNFAPEDIIAWHDDSVLPVLVVIIRGCPVQIKRRSLRQVYWWPEGGHGWTEALDKTVQRLRMLHEPRRMQSQNMVGNSRAQNTHATCR